MAFLVAVCGGSCSGKSTLAALVVELLGTRTASLLALDSYYHDQTHLKPARRAQVNYDHPDSLDIELFAHHLDELAAGRAVEAPIYDFADHARSTSTRRIEAAPVVILDGILLLADDRLVDRFDMRIFRDCPEDVRLQRRIKRDVAYRGRTEESVRAQFAATVKPMHDTFVGPSADHADVVFHHDRIEVDQTAEIVASRIRSSVATSGRSRRA